MNNNELQQAANATTTELVSSAQTFTNSLMGKGFKPLVSALIRYIKITNARLTKIEGESNGN
ncbi:hypothetical protein [Moritella sp.]|uniref:hypothetical protein n=1 Tax=Moritella sp. TaxID=78556 RepID=UPI000C0DF85A|nr:hypothetical protein [Moritella sp.]MCJ8350740.1 hypothetical protein [Moritella sp.]NQZ42026.1 hypothetical protein [Moritella sp.]